MAGARLANATAGAQPGNQNASRGARATADGTPDLVGTITTAQAAALTGASERSIRAARAILRHGDEEIIRQVEDGSLRIFEAARIIVGRPDPVPPEQQRTALYRHYRADGTLLYVGISSTPVHRARRHARSSHWVEQADYFTGRWYDTWAEAKEAESRAIKEESPLYNIHEKETTT